MIRTVESLRYTPDNILSKGSNRKMAIEKIKIKASDVTLILNCGLLFYIVNYFTGPYLTSKSMVLQFEVSIDRL
jgi:hypothetical protein